MKHRILILFLILTNGISAQTLADFNIPDTVALHGSLQGMATYGHHAFLLRDGGQCIILDLNRRQFCAAFQLDSNNTHCNNASFSNRFYHPADPFPLLYVSSCYGDKACLVYRIDTLGATLLQRIIFDSPRFPIAQDWCLDTAQGHIYAYGGRRGGTMHLLRFQLPDITSRLVLLTDSLVLHDTPIQCVNIAQGSCISNGRAYLPDGIPGQAAIHIIDLESGNELQSISLNHLNLEPEGISLRPPYLQLSFHTPSPRNNLLLSIPLNHE
ncbi:MAG: hypothetical protein MJZ99_10645 [Bacteroidales bacterium]|nr:hypothetical protein [Bacteroidales bacterium]